MRVATEVAFSATNLSSTCRACALEREGTLCVSAERAILLRPWEAQCESASILKLMSSDLMHRFEQGLR